MSEIKAFAVDQFNGGKWRLLYAAEGGTLPVTTMEGVVQAPYSAGDIMLTGDGGFIVAGPISHSGAIALAERILNGDQRAATSTAAKLSLCIALLAFAPLPEPTGVEPSTQQAHGETDDHARAG